MDFHTVARGHTNAEDWYDRLHISGKQCAGLDFGEWFSTATTVPEAYCSAVAWHNIFIDERFESEVQERAFASFIDRLLDPVTGASTSSDVNLLSFLHNVDTLQKKAFKAEYYQDIVSSGERPGPTISFDTEGWDRLASLLKHVPPPPSDSPDPEVNPQAYLEWYLTQTAPPLLWLTRYRDIEDCLSSKDVRGALALVGGECKAPKNVYVIMLESKAIWDDLRVPTVADSQFYYLWGATRRKPYQPTGMTRHTLLGRGYGVPELVVKTKRLVPLLDSGEVWLEVKGLKCDPLYISREHAEKCWHEEIEPDI